MSSEILSLIVILANRVAKLVHHRLARLEMEHAEIASVEGSTIPTSLLPCYKNRLWASKACEVILIAPTHRPGLNSELDQIMRPHEHTKIAILADLGTLRAFRLSPPHDPLVPHQGPTTVEEICLPSHERNTDRPGRFPIGQEIDRRSAMSPGENHHERSEYERRRIQFIAEEIENVLSQEECKLWCLAAPATINQRILDHLHPENRQFLATNLKADLTHISKRELEERFLTPHPA